MLKDTNANFAKAMIFALVIFLPISYYSQYLPSNDFDGDGIINSIDVDDDNDGILDTVELAPCNSSLPAKSTITATSSLGWSATTFASILNDNNADNTLYSNPNGQSLVGANYLTFQFPSSIILNRIELVGHSNQIMSAGSVIKVQGSTNGTSWIDLTGNITYSLTTGAISGTANSQNLPFTNNTNSYRYYRILGVSGTTVNWYLNEANFSVGAAQSCDSDNDGISNQFDLDSDGDGCSDAKEATVTPSSQLVTVGTFLSAQFPASSFVDANADGLYDGATQSTYSLYALSQPLNVCSDFDGDGLGDLVDIDDDNDGILDSVENVCTAKTEGPPIFSNDFGTDASGATSTIPDTYIDTSIYSFPNTFEPYDGTYIITTSYIRTANYTQTNLAPTYNKDAGYNDITAGSITGRYMMINIASQASLNKAIYKVPNLAVTVGRNYRFRIDMAGLADNSADIPYLQLTVKDSSTNTVIATANSSSIGMANDDIWRRLSLEFIATSSSVTIEIVNLQPNGDYGNDLGLDNIVLTSYSCDLDADGIPNHLDLDSDGDGCSDAKEAAVTPSAALVAVGAILNAQYPVSTFVDANADGLYDTASQTTYNVFATTSSLNVCADTDGDGIGDLTDIDDDNDGIVDTVELAPCNIALNTSARKALMTSTSEIPAASGTAANLIDGTENNNYYFTGSSSITNKAIAQFDLGTNYYLNGFEISTNGSSFFNTGATYKIQGSYDASNWKDLTGSTTAATGAQTAGMYNTAIANTYKFPFTSTAPYRYYRVYGISGTVNGGPWVREVYFSTATPTFCDTDNDNVSNDKDLDSDGDGCSDAREASVSPAASLVSSGIYTNAKFDFKSPTNDSNNDGLFDGAAQYSYKYALLSTFNACSATCTNNAPLSLVQNNYTTTNYQTTTTLNDLTFTLPGYTFNVTSEGYSSLTINYNANNCDALLQTQVLVNDVPIGTNCSSGSRTITNPTTVKLSAIRTGGTGNNFFPMFFWNGTGILWYDDGGSGIPEAIINITGTKNLCKLDSQTAFSSVPLVDATIQSSATLSTSSSFALAISSPYTIAGNQIYNGATATGLIISGNDTNTLVISNIATPALYKSILESVKIRSLDGYSCTNPPQINLSAVTDYCKQDYCYKPGISDAVNKYPSNHGITALERAGADNSNWPMVRQSAWTVLEAKTKGFVINRVKFNASNLPVADDGNTAVITSPVEGMLVYDTTNHCLKLYTSTDGGVTFGWYCLTQQGCPD